MTPLDDYYQERISELDEEIYRLRETINSLTIDLADATGMNDQLERELAALRSPQVVNPPAAA